MHEEWEWDETLFGGSARYYRVGRLAYPPELADAFREELVLDGTGRLLDVGSGTGEIALLLAPLYDEVVGLDADGEMIAESAAEASRRGVRNARWVHARAEELPLDLGRFRTATFAQSFHWMDRERVAETVRTMLEPDGAWVHVNATTHYGAPSTDDLPFPRPPRDEIRELIVEFLGETRRAGHGTLSAGTPAGEEEIMAAVGFRGPRRRLVPGGRLYVRTEDDLVASVYAVSGSAPHLFGNRRDEFEQRLRQLLRQTSPEGRFAERSHETELVIWTLPE